MSIRSVLRPYHHVREGHRPAPRRDDFLECSSEGEVCLLFYTMSGVADMKVVIVHVSAKRPALICFGGIGYGMVTVRHAFGTGALSRSTVAIPHFWVPTSNAASRADPPD